LSPVTTDDAHYLAVTFLRKYQQQTWESSVQNGEEGVLSGNYGKHITSGSKGGWSNEKKFACMRLASFPGSLCVAH